MCWYLLLKTQGSRDLILLTILKAEALWECSACAAGSLRFCLQLLLLSFCGPMKNITSDHAHSSQGVHPYTPPLSALQSTFLWYNQCVKGLNFTLRFHI